MVIGGIVLAAGLGAWLRWGITPVRVAFRAGMEVERVNADQKGEGRGERLSPEGAGPVGGGR